VKTISNDEVTYTFTHDAKRRLKTRTDSRFGRTLAFDYDAADRVTRKTDYQGDVTEYQYDATGRLVAERNAAYLQASYHYDGAGRLLNRILSNGSQSDYSYDAAGRLRSLHQRTADGTPVLEVTYDEYDAVGNLKKTTTNNNQVALYSYDAVHRLLGADLPGTANDVTYTYDGVGNRETEVTPSGSRYYIYGAGNRLLEIHSGSAGGPLLRSFTYSDAGEVESKRDGSGNVLYTLQRSSQGRVVGITSPAVSQTLGYDPMDLRVRRSPSGGPDERYHLEGEHLEAIYDAAGTLEAKFLRGSVIDEVVNGYFYDASGKPTNYTYHHDTLQSVVGLSGHTGSVAETQSYGPFGSSLGSTGSSPSELRYTGRERDPATGLYYYRARYYDPEIGRFLSEDPMGFEGGDVNEYAYVGNNPLGANDPRGECPICVPLLIAGGAIAAGGAVGLTVTAAVGETSMALTNASPQKVSEFRQGLGGTAMIVEGVAGLPVVTGGALYGGEALLTNPAVTSFIVNRIPQIVTTTTLASQRPQSAVGVLRIGEFIADPSGSLRRLDQKLGTFVEAVGRGISENPFYPSQQTESTTSRAYSKP